jgi:hypothetical protein
MRPVRARRPDRASTAPVARPVPAATAAIAAVALVALATAVLLAAPARLAAQAPGDPYTPHGPWRTLETERFTVHYPAEAAAWTHRLVSRMDAMGAAVAERIGHEPATRVRVLVADPANISNGFAVSLLNGPFTVLFTTPPEPRSGIGEHREWSELLFIHEYAHLAHLTFEPRNPRDRLRQRLLPVRTSPVARGTPRWVKEGYATVIEGELTGHGRPHGTVRPAFLRLRALEGRLPTYAGLNAGAGYQDAAAAYLAGSAYLEWLQARAGDDALNHLWRRLSAVERRPFAGAFAGVFGAQPDELYGRFAVELTERALAVRDSIAARGGVVAGDLVLERRWHTGDPALSPDGALLAIELHQRDAPSRLVILSTAPDTAAHARRERARERLAERDPLDVPAVEQGPPPLRTVATLQPVAGRGHRSPRWLPGGEELLVVRSEPLGDGRVRPDLFVWNHGTGALRRVTRGAALRDPDPAPDGRTAAAVHCEWGVCDVVRVDLATGDVARLAAGSPDVVFYRPRFSPDGATILISVQERGRWRLATVPATGGAATFVDPDDGASRFDGAWLPGGGIVAVSTRGGIADLERLEPATGAVRTLTRVLGAAAAPEPGAADGAVHFLSLHSRGWDLRRLHPDSVPVADPAPLPAALWPIVAWAPEAAPDTFPPGPVPASRPYGLGPRRFRVLPAGYHDADGGALHLAVTSTDPLGRLSTRLLGALGAGDAWRGASAAATLRVLPVALALEAFLTRGPEWLPGAALGPAGAGSGVAVASVPVHELDYSGGFLALTAGRDWSPTRLELRLGASAGRLDGGPTAPIPGGAPGDVASAPFDAAPRLLGVAELRAATARIRGRQRTAVAAEAHLASGRTDGEAWTRGVAGATLTGRIAGRGPALEARGQYGRILAGAPELERFRVGGTAPLLFDRALFRQQFAMPGLPAGILAGDHALALELAPAAGGFRPYLWAGSTDADLRSWVRVLGVERRIDFAGDPRVGIPAATGAVGVAHTLDEPFRRRTRAYFAVELR